MTPNDLIADGLNPNIAQLLCGALDDLKYKKKFIFVLIFFQFRPMSVHLSTNNKTTRSPCNFVQIPLSSSSPPLSSSLPPLLDAALMTVVQQQQQSSRTPPPGFDRNQFEHILINFAGVRSSLSSSPSPKLPKTGTVTGGTNTNIPPPPPPPPPPLAPLSSSSSSSNCPPANQHHVPLLTTHSFLYNPVEPCIFPIAIPPGFPSASPDFMRLFAPNMAAVAAAAAAANNNNPSGTSFVSNSNGPQGSILTSRSTTQSNGTLTPPEQNGQNLYHPSSSASSTISRHQPSHYRHRQHYPSDSHQFQQNLCHPHQQRQSQTSYPQQQQQHNRPKACYTCGDIGHLAFACPEQYLSDSNYSHNTRGKIQDSNSLKKINLLDGYKLDYRPRQSTPTNLHQQQQQRQMRSNSNSKTKVRDNS